MGSPSPKNLAAQKHQNFGFCDLIANISGQEQDIVDRKTALKTAITPLRAYQTWWTLVHKWRKIGQSFRPTQSTFSDAHILGAKGRCPLKIFTVGRGWPTLANAHLIGDGSAPNNFLTPEIRKLAKNLVYCRGLFYAPNFPTWCVPIRDIKCPQLILGVLLPKNFGGEKRSFQLRHFVTLLQISPDWNKISSTGKRRCSYDHSHTCLPNLVNFGPQTAKMGPFFNPLKINFLDAHISGLRVVVP